jgi:hypothetical protein
MHSPLAAMIVAEAIVGRPEARLEARARRQHRRAIIRSRLRWRGWPHPSDTNALRVRRPAAT